MYLALYVACVVLANALFALLEPVLLLGAMVPPASVVAGAVFIARDFAHRANPRAIWPAMIAAALLSALFVHPTVAVASLVAFGVSEGLDALVFVRASGSFRKRVILSSLIAVPIDTVLFLWLALDGLISLLPSAMLVTASKLLALLVLLAVRERGVTSETAP